MAWKHDPNDPKQKVFGNMQLFRDLTDAEEQEFREYAQQNDPPDLGKWDIYHPVCREEWMKRGIKPPEDKG